MANLLLRHLISLVLAALFIFLVGCGSSPPTRFYVLHSMDVKESPESSGAGCVSIGVGPVRVAEYLERPQIVTRVTPHEIMIADFDQWAEPLGQNISRVLADNLSALLCTTMVVVFPWKGSVPLDFQVEVDILRLDGNPGKDASLEVQWMALDLRKAKRVVAFKKLSFTEPTGGQDYRALVAAESHNLEVLSRDIAATIGTLSR